MTRDPQARGGDAAPTWREARGQEGVTGGWRRLHRRTLAASAVLSLPLVAPIVAVLAKVLSDADASDTVLAASCLGAAVLVIAAVLVYDVLRWRATSYRITPERVELRSGIVTRGHRSIPRERVRTVDVTAAPVRRVFGLAVVKVGTGEKTSSESDELTLDPLGRAEAELLRTVLLHGGEAPAGGSDAPLAALSWSWIRYAPLTVWSLLGGLLLLGVTERGLKIVGIDLFTMETLGRAWELVRETPPGLVAAALVGVNVGVGTAGALAVFAVAWAGYRLDREPSGTLRLRRGLLTRRSLTVAGQRVRGVTLAQPMLLRWGGGAKVKAVVTGLAEDDDDKLEKSDTLTPPVPLEVALRVAGAVSPGDLPALRPHPRAAATRRLRWAVLAVAAMAAAVAGLDAAFAWTPWWAWAVPAAALPVSVALALDAYRGLGHGLTAAHLVCRSGTATRATVMLERPGIIGWTVRQTAFQRRAGLATLVATTAAGDGSYSVRDAGQDAVVDLACRAVPGLLTPFRVPPGDGRAHRDGFVIATAQQPPGANR